MLRDELLNGEIFYSITEAKVLIEQWRRHYNTIRPHSSLGYQAARTADHRASPRRSALRCREKYDYAEQILGLHSPLNKQSKLTDEEAY